VAERVDVQVFVWVAVSVHVAVWLEVFVSVQIAVDVQVSVRVFLSVQVPDFIEDSEQDLVFGLIGTGFSQPHEFS